jgi:hypothetical protein
MEDKYLETGYSNTELEAEDLENVAGGRKWGDTDKSFRGPVNRQSFIKVADLGTKDVKDEDPDEVPACIAAITEHHSRSGGII